MIMPAMPQPLQPPRQDPIGGAIGRFLQDKAPELLRQISQVPQALSVVKAAVTKDPAGFVEAIEKYRASLADDQPQAASIDEEE